MPTRPRPAHGATLRFRSAALGTWYKTWAVVAPHGYTSIDGSHGSILMQSRAGDGPSVFTSRFEEPGYIRGWRQLQMAELPRGELHYRKLADLVDAVLDNRQPAITGADGRDAIELVMAIYRFAEAGQPVSLPLTRSAAVTTPPFQPVGV